MQYVEGFPKTMVHPSSRPAKLSMDIAATASTPGYYAPAGSPARYLPETVHSPEQEADMRARGYLDVGEPPAQVHYAEYPKILRHSHYTPAVKATQRSVVVKNKDGESDIKIIDVPAREEQFPDKTVATAEEEKHWRGEGWAPAGEWDSAAFERAHSTPDVAYDPQEWPKWVATGEVDKDGKPIAVLMEDPNAVPAAERERLAHEYPKWVNGRKVASAADEAAIANGGEAVLEVPGVAAPVIKVAYVPASIAPPQPIFDVAALKAEILGELVPQIRDVIREALAPKDWRLGGELITAHRPNPAKKTARKAAKRTLTAEQRKAIGERFAAGKQAARERREAEAG